MKNTIKPLIPDVVKNGLKNVFKYTYQFNTSESYVKDIQTIDDVWIPSVRELFLGYNNTHESTGPVYTKFFENSDSLKKGLVTSTDGYSYWLTRTAQSKSDVNSVDNSGSKHYAGAENERGVCLGVCT